MYLPSYSCVRLVHTPQSSLIPGVSTRLDHHHDIMLMVRPLGLDEDETRFPDNLHMKEVTLSALRNGRLYPR